MARKKRTSKVLEIARQRLAGLKKITPKPELGNITVETYEAEVNGFITEQDAYNGELAQLDERTNRLDTREQQLSDLNQRVLAAVKGQYGPDSSEFEQVGGIRRSDRKRPTRAPRAPAV
jgi:hypothetical protein